MTTENSVPFLLLLILLAISVDGESSPVSFSADWMICGNASADGKACARRSVGGTYKVTLVKTANACAISYADKGLLPVLTSGRLTFIGSEEWTCAGTTPIQGFPRLAKMTDGRLTISPLSESGNSLFDEAVESNNGVWGKLLHWGRVSADMGCAQKYVKVKLCDS